jgi:hypothetical protein
MDRFIERQNIAHYVEQLKTVTDPIKREMLQQLLAEEKAKQASHANDYPGGMVPFIYRCPITGRNVQGFFADEEPAKQTDIYVPVTCLACTRVHLVNRSTGKTLQEDTERVA